MCLSVLCLFDAHDDSDNNEDASEDNACDLSTIRATTGIVAVISIIVGVGANVCRQHWFCRLSC